VQCFFLKITMVANNEVIMKKDFLVNLVAWLWTKISSSSIFKHKFREFIKLVWDCICSSPWIYGRCTLFLNNGIHEK
jgi:hypothetical protein